jgi:ubiquitin related modifier 1
MIQVKIELSGGLELLFSSKKAFDVSLDVENPTIRDLIIHLEKNYLKQRPELFVSEENGVRPGILVLINDVDWELEDKENYKISNGDQISFISTLHGG